MRVVPDPKPARRIVNAAAGRQKIKLEARCRLTGQWAPDRFHLVGRDLGGDDIDDNIIPISHEIHMQWEHDPDGKRIWGPRIWRVLEEVEKEYVLEKKGPEYVWRYFGWAV